MTGGTLSILLSFTSGILSLVGLMSIFISMNSQHNVQRSREILWSLAALPYKKDLFLEKGAIGKEVFRKYILYEQIINEKQEFSKIIIGFAQIALVFCALIWITLAFNHFVIDRSLLEQFFLMGGLLVTVLFVLYFVIKILGDLKSTSKVGRLPTVLEIIDADQINIGLSIITLAAITSCLRIVQSTIYLGFPLPFKNIRINLSVLNSDEEWIRQTMGDRLKNFEYCMEKFKKLEPNKFKLLGDDYCWYPVYSLKEEGKYPNGVLVTVEMISQEGLVTTEFYVEDLPGDSDSSLSIFPYSFNEQFINRISELDPFSIYSERNSSDVPDELPKRPWYNLKKK
ncbi:hypothetical protein [Desulfosporosinus sp. Sb-LF]|uniref:hypothetical protein n=1 Tax=Desulfosporosinus sp. Sb-LF TaxID=2560027 RepID=UPI00107F7D76|nr:hypothetical protein [Desulfosporosinus sp. Sb-LF]TGE33564.1 hypothetical protein E4K68_05300 [Desulfosporosinus sp. Sb-LF]